MKCGASNRRLTSSALGDAISRPQSLVPSSADLSHFERFAALIAGIRQNAKLGRLLACAENEGIEELPALLVVVERNHQIAILNYAAQNTDDEGHRIKRCGSDLVDTG